MAKVKSNETKKAVREAARNWIRGVNLGGWLVTERWITPYLFAITSCHLNGDFCSWPKQIDAPPSLPSCRHFHGCTPVRSTSVGDDTTSSMDYPIDEYTLVSAFPSKTVAREYMENHWNTFVTKQDIEKLKRAGVTHVRVPLGYWIVDIAENEPWVNGGWKYFARLVHWCREVGLEVWPDLHGAPGSQNGFDNSGRTGQTGSSCFNWCNSTENVNRTLQVIDKISNKLVTEEMTDVVTGFGVLNEPFEDCNVDVLKDFNKRAFQIIRAALGQDVAIFIGDMFHADLWNSGWWLDNTTYQNTFLDSHPYHVFFEQGRAMTPKEHIAYVCRKNHREVVSCCYEDYPDNNSTETVNTIPSSGIQRMVGEWSASYDTLPTALIDVIMDGIANNGTAPFLDRTLSKDRQAFLRDFVEAQMVTYEAAATGVSRGWFFWNFKMEGGAFAEWDFLRGVDEGWIPLLPPPNVSSVDLYGTCEDIVKQTNDNYSVVEEYPDPSTLDWSQWQGWSVDDDFVLGQERAHTMPLLRNNKVVSGVAFVALFLVVLAYSKNLFHATRRKEGYEQLS